MNNKQLFAYLSVLVCLMGCTSAPAQIKPIKANAEIYKKEDCEKISWRAQDVSSCLNKLDDSLHTAAAKDKLLAYSAILFWPTIFFVGRHGQEEYEYAVQSGKYNALTEAATAKNCPGFSSTQIPESDLGRENTTDNLNLISPISDKHPTYETNYIKSVGFGLSYGGVLGWQHATQFDEAQFRIALGYPGFAIGGDLDIYKHMSIGLTVTGLYLWGTAVTTNLNYYFKDRYSQGWRTSLDIGNASFSLTGNEPKSVEATQRIVLFSLGYAY